MKIFEGDALVRLLEMDDESVQCCVTSPPYFGLRDYGTASWEGGNPDCDHKPPDEAGVTNKPSTGQREHAGRFSGPACWKCNAIRIDNQLGLEKTPDEYVVKMVEIFHEVRRVLRDDGTLWLNIGDSYVGSWGNQGRKEDRGTQRPINGAMMQPVHDERYPSNGSKTGTIPEGSNLKPKDLVGIPWMLAFALRADGWYLRQDIIWAKPNPMPESVTDRCTKSHEYLFLLSKSPRYYFDSDAIKEPSVTCDPRRPYTSQGTWDLDGRSVEQRHGGKPRTAGNKTHKLVTEYEGSDSEEHRTAAGLMRIADVPWETRNKRDVWSVATQPFKEAHFATFPPKLIEPCILAGCPVGGVVLDPFAGSGTTGLVALRNRRHFIGIELNPDYIAMANNRLLAEVLS